MNEPKWTPGPWQRNIKPAKHYPTIFSGRNKHVAYIKPWSMSDDEAEANIDLICAAPELYAQLSYVMSILKAIDMAGNDRQITDAFETTRSLLAKARGGAPC